MAYLFILVLIMLLFPSMSFYSYLAVAITLQQFFLVFYSFNYVIPIRYIAGSLFCVQLLLGPVLAYNGVNDIQYFKYKMQVPEAEYFILALPAVTLMLLGLHINSRLRGEKVNVPAIRQYVEANPNFMYLLIGIGFFASFFGSAGGSTFSYLFYILSGCKFIGAFLVLIGSKQLKPLPVILVFGSVITASLAEGMFHDLVTWALFLLAYVALKYKPTNPVKVISAIAFTLAIIVIQQLKETYRASIGEQGNAAGIEAFDDALRKSQAAGALFDATSMARNTVRINQGFIVTYVMTNVPARVPYANGAELWQIIEAAILPRFLAPNKLKAGDNSIVNKYAGFYIREGTSMSLSALGDGYVNFGPIGACIFMFFFGLIFNLLLIQFYNYSKVIPIVLVFLPLVFYYPIRPDTALQTALGHLVKTTMVLYTIYFFWKRALTVSPGKQKTALVSQ